MKGYREILKNLSDSIERIDTSRLRKSDLYVVSLLKELIAMSSSVLDKVFCIGDYRGIKTVGALCGRKWVVTDTDSLLSIYKIGFGGGVVIDRDNRSLMIYNRGYSIVFYSNTVSASIPTATTEIDIRRVEGVSENASLISKTFSRVVETLRRAEEDLSRCIKTERIKC